MKFASTKTAVIFALSLVFVTAMGVARASQFEVEPSGNQGERIEDSITPNTCPSTPYC